MTTHNVGTIGLPTLSEQRNQPSVPRAASIEEDKAHSSVACAARA